MFKKMPMTVSTLFFMLFTGLHPFAAAQDIQVAQTTITIPKKVLVEQNMQIDDKQAAEFWKIYGDYEIALDQTHQQTGELIHFYAKNYRTLSDEDAQSMIDKYLQIERDKIGLREAYVPKFKSILSARQVARLYQIENKIDAITRFGLVDAIPLVNTTAQVEEPANEQ